jgi:hypothetical protein
MYSSHLARNSTPAGTYDPLLVQQEVPVRSEMAVLFARPVLRGVLIISTSSTRVPNGAWLLLWFQFGIERRHGFARRPSMRACFRLFEHGDACGE